MALLLRSIWRIFLEGDRGQLAQCLRTTFVKCSPPVDGDVDNDKNQTSSIKFIWVYWAVWRCGLAAAWLTSGFGCTIWGLRTHDGILCRVQMAFQRGNDTVVSSAASRSRSFQMVAWHSGHYFGSVKWSARLLLLVCFLLLATSAVVTYPRLSVADEIPAFLWVGASRRWTKDVPFQNLQNSMLEDQSERNGQSERSGQSGSLMPRFNESFLEFAAVDPTEESDKRKIRMILDGKVDEIHSARNKWSYQKRMDHYMDVDRNPLKLRPRYESWLLQLQAPRFAQSWTRFRQMLQGWNRYRYYDPTVMQDLMQFVKKPLDQFNAKDSGSVPGEEGERYKTCAVVGNSGILLNSSYGHLIDSHDMVIRLNNARVLGFEEFVGSKATLSFVNSNVYHACSRRLKCFCHPYGEVPMIMYLCQVQHMMDVAYCGPNQQAPVLVTDPRLDTLCYRLVKWYSVKSFVETTGNPIEHWAKHHDPIFFHYSSGFQAIVLALGICDKVDIFGFGKSSQAKHHYHTNQKAELTLHDYEAEYLFYEDLAENRISSIPFFHEVPDFTFPKVEIFK
ncbi:hypothetical protein R1flu_020505 [Riccia fluitans]|uniref:Uncharacterized protein n=1 Tax=Riccia fluitans TaxID=41844 RepID=A0ABD1ZM53_9MARC